MTIRSEEHTSELQSHLNLVCRLLLEKKKIKEKPRQPLCGQDVYSSHVRLAATHLMHRQSLYLQHSTLLLSYENVVLFFFFFNDTATTEIYTFSLHDALPILFSAAVVCLSELISFLSPLSHTHTHS